MVRVSRRKDNEGIFVASVAGTAAVVIAVSGIERMAADASVAAVVVFRIRHGEEMRGINRHEKFEVDFAGGKFVSELSEEPLKLTAGRIIGDVERIAQGFEDTTALFMRRVSIGSELFDCVEIISRVVVGTRKEANGIVDKNALFPISVEFGGSKKHAE